MIVSNYYEQNSKFIVKGRQPQLRYMNICIQLISRYSISYSWDCTLNLHLQSTRVYRWRKLRGLWTSGWLWNRHIRPVQSSSHKTVSSKLVSQWYQQIPEKFLWTACIHKWLELTFFQPVAKPQIWCCLKQIWGKIMTIYIVRVCWNFFQKQYIV